LVKLSEFGIHACSRLCGGPPPQIKKHHGARYSSVAFLLNTERSRVISFPQFSVFGLMI
jgi:hypothetical protein